MGTAILGVEIKTGDVVCMGVVENNGIVSHYDNVTVSDVSKGSMNIKYKRSKDSHKNDGSARWIGGEMENVSENIKCEKICAISVMH